MAYEMILKDDVILRLVILFAADKYGKPLTNPELTEFILSNNEIDYFLLQHNIYELTKMEKIRVFKEFGKDYYEITADGSETIGFFHKKIPLIVRNKITFAVEQALNLDKPQTKVVADFTPEGNEFLAGVKLIENGQEQFSMNILVPRREHAIAVCEYFEDNISKIYRDMNEDIMKLF